MSKEDIAKLGRDIIDLCNRYEWQIKNDERQREYIKGLEEENRKLKYEYSDSLLNRDKPLPVKWRREVFKNGEGIVRQFCPKCGMSVSNWYRYCLSCGQKLAEGNLLPEMEIKENE